jgi:8-amino-7-oxononanoate synthase
VSFVSPSYLGLERDSRVADAAAQAVRRFGVTTATPRALLCDPFTHALERGLAAWVGQPAALVFPSSTHAACDVLPSLAGRNGAVLVDEWAYPTSLEGARAARMRGARFYRFLHNDLASLTQMLRHAAGAPRKVIVVDGIYVAGGRPAPLAALVKLADAFDALVYVDDSHALGPLGGGLLRNSRLPGTRVIVAGTLTKALGVPVAFAAGASTLMRRTAASAKSFVHNSPPSIPNLAAACAALRVEAAEGERLRAKLAGLVARFRRHASEARIPLAPTTFPIQTVPVSGDPDSAMRAMAAAGIRPALQVDSHGVAKGYVLRFFITARHTPAEIDAAILAIARCRSSTIVFVEDARHERGARGDAESRVEEAQVRRNGPWTDVQRCSDLFVGHPLRDERDDFALACREAVGCSA